MDVGVFVQQRLENGAFRGGDGIVERHGLIAHKVITTDFPLLAGSAEIFGDNTRKDFLMFVDAALYFGEIEVGGAALTVEAVGLCKRNAADEDRCGVKGFTQ